MPGDAGGGTLAELTALLARHTGTEPRRVALDARLADDLGINSLDMVDLIVAAEDRFEVLIPDEAAERFETVGDVVRFLDRAKAGAPAAASARPGATRTPPPHAPGRP